MENFTRISVRTFLLLAGAVAALALAACGGGSSDSSSSSGPDPATVTPADAFLYGQATIKPDGSQKDDLDSALQKLTGSSDIGGTISSQLDQSFSDKNVSFSNDIDPILGSTMGGFVDGVSGNSGDGAVAFSVTDTGAAQDLFDKLGQGESKDASYSGVDYKVSTKKGDDSAYGVIGDFAVIGTEQAFKDAVDASNGNSLADDSTATDALGSVPDETLASAYIDPKAAVDAAVSSGAITQKQLDQSGISDQIDQLGDTPVILAAGATSGSLSLQASGPANGSSGGSDIVSTLPAGAWLAFGASDVGQTITKSYEQFLQGFQLGFQSGIDNLNKQIGGGASVQPQQLPDVSATIKKATGLDISKDFGWVGDVGGFLQGSSPLDIGGGLVIQTDNAAQATATLAKLRKALGRERSLKITPGSDGGFNIQPVGTPIGAEVAIRNDKVVFAFAGATIDDVLQPSQTLGDADNFKSAADALGDGVNPTFYLDATTLLSLLQNSGSTSDPSFQQALPYLSAIDYLVVGSGVSGDRMTGRIVLGLKQSDGGSDTTAAAIQP